MQRNKKQCPKCNKEISLSNYVKHINSCNGEINNKILIQEEWLQENGLYKCPHCNKEYVKKGISYHIWKMHTEEGKLFDSNKGYKEGTRKIWNKGLTKETNKSIKQIGETYSNKIKLIIRRSFQ